MARIRATMGYASALGGCMFCDDQRADANGVTPENAIVHQIEPGGPMASGTRVRLCENCLLAAIQATGVAARRGAPLDKMALGGWPLRGDGEVRHAVILMLYPPVELRDAPREVIEQIVATRRAGLLREITETIYRAYTSDPADAATARMVGEAVVRHADSLSRG